MDPQRLEPAVLISPVGEAGRIDSIDVLRGLALLGIFVMNIPTFALSYYAFFNPSLQGGFEGADYWAWLTSHLLFDQKMMSIFSMLFGAGIVLFAERIRQSCRSAASVHYRRMGWLLVIGLLHAYFIWYGDILVAYALVGMLIYPLYKLRPRTLLVLALVLLPIASIFGVVQQIFMDYTRSQAEIGTEWAVEAWGEMQLSFYPDQDALDIERAAMLGSFGDRARYAAPTVVMMQTWVFLTWGLWRVASMMLLGMALFKWGVLSGRRTARFYGVMAAFGLGIGFPLILLGVNAMSRTGFDPLKIMGVNGAYNYFGSVAVALAWVSGIMLICKFGALEWMRGGLAAVGRMAFTNYLMQSLIAAFIFYGWGLGSYGATSRSELLLVVAGVWAFQIIFSVLWLKRFRFGPMEWLWRSLTYWRLAPMLRSDPVAINPEGDTGR